MATELHWVHGPWQGALALAARPRGGDWLEDEMADWRNHGVDRIVSLLEAVEAHDLDLNSEGLQARAHAMQFQNLPIADRQVPTSTRSFAETLDALDEELMNGRNVLLHCRQGIGRTGLVAACLLTLRGTDAASAVKVLSEVRGAAVPETPEQLRWIESFAESRAHAR